MLNHITKLGQEIEAMKVEVESIVAERQKIEEEISLLKIKVSVLFFQEKFFEEEMKTKAEWQFDATIYMQELHNND